MDTLLVHRLHFAFTITYHYLFPQLTMGLAPLIVVLKTLALRTERRALPARPPRFWARIFGINFVMGVVTGIPMEFQFGTNWAHFSHVAGGVIGQTLAMEGVFAFFLESAFLGLFLFGEKRLEPRALTGGPPWLVLLGSWLSGFFIICHRCLDAASGRLRHRPRRRDRSSRASGPVCSTRGRWWQYAHNMVGPVITGSFVDGRRGRVLRSAGPASRRRPHASCEWA